MVDRRIADRRSVARQCTRTRRRPDAMRAWHRLLPGLFHLALCQRLRRWRLAHYVPDRRHSGGLYTLATHRRSGIGEVASQQRKAKSREIAKKERRQAE